MAADARLLQEAGLETNEAALTGESVPVGKSPAVCARDTLLPERGNMCSSAPRSRGAAAAR